MKKLLLINLLFLITPYAKADMDYVCDLTKVGFPIINYQVLGKVIKMLNCERNNILYVEYGEGFEQTNRIKAVASYCRFDRNVFETNIGFTCVLYNSKSRTFIET